MDIDNLTIGEAKQLASMFGGQAPKPAERFLGQPVLIRTYSAGVHFGVLVERNGREVVLADARRIWSWQGAKTLHEIATAGVSVGSKISVPVSMIALTEAIEIIPMNSVSVASLGSITW